MKVAKLLGFFVLVGVLDLALGRPLDENLGKDQRNASIYILGNLHNAAVSHNFSKTQAASDRNESEWNSTEMNNNVIAAAAYDEDRKKRDAREDFVVYAGGDATNLAFAYEGSESQSAENDQKSGYNNQNLGLLSGVEDDRVEEEVDQHRKRK